MMSTCWKPLRPTGPQNNIANVRFGHLVVRRFSHMSTVRGAMWFCDCDCGTKGELRAATDLRQGAVVQCHACAKRARLSALDGHRGKRHAVAVLGPDDTRYPSLREAATAAGISCAGMSKRVAKATSGWRRADQETSP